MRLVTVNPEEASFLTREVKQKYEELSGEELVITSYLARYEQLMEMIKSKSGANGQVDIVSTGLLRKLLESGKRNEATTINRQFIDICYLFITDSQFNRAQYNEKFGSSSELENVPTSAPTKTLNWPFKNQRIHFSFRKDVFLLSTFMFVGLFSWVLVANWQYILLQIPTPAPKFVWWVAEYPDGTKVYNNFRRYRTEQEVIEYFMGLGLDDGSRDGDCNAIYWRNNYRTNVCYDNIETINKFEKQHGGKPEIRFDG